ncbi:unnamed protein product [Caenorhabditis bovis]|uniref:Uncharacterized protein n=1 Tax=Caenorhabditis bovis TaxID=2654633 RepID=A0A8S1F7F2_9PELO|nr:unnamed protein product [Caenorhabditis bovis]
MLVAKKAVQVASILCHSLSPAEQINFVKSIPVDRNTKSVLRECLICAMSYESSNKEEFVKAKTMVKKNKGVCEIVSRSAAFTAAAALKLKKWSDVDKMLEYAEYSPPVITSSIRICALAAQSRLDEALDELEKVLMKEEEVFGTQNYCVSEQALDELCEAIKLVPDSTEKMKRFRNLQRMVTKYGRRTTKSISELLYTPIRLPNIQTSTESPKEFIETDKFDEFVKSIPYLKDESLKK